MPNYDIVTKTTFTVFADSLGEAVRMAEHLDSTNQFMELYIGNSQCPVTLSISKMEIEGAYQKYEHPAKKQT